MSERQLKHRDSRSPNAAPAQSDSKPGSLPAALASRLRREAIQSRPEFSESLHRRVLSAIRQRHGETDALRLATVASASRWRRFAAVLTAACVVAGIAVGGWLAAGGWQRLKYGANAQPSLAALPTIGELADQATSGLDSLISPAAMKPRAADLTHDAYLVAGTLLDPLPVGVALAGEP